MQHVRAYRLFTGGNFNAPALAAPWGVMNNRPRGRETSDEIGRVGMLVCQRVQSFIRSFLRHVTEPSATG